MGQPALFRQTRPGRHGRPFEMIKFRTMLDANDANGNPLPDAERVTQFGRFLRSTSLDELPELWNVLKGDEPCWPATSSDGISSGVLA